MSKSPITSVLITGANAGIGRELARQLATATDVTRIYLACRNPDKAAAAIAGLRAETGRNIYELITLDTADLDSARGAALALPQPIDAVVLNAGGTGGKTPTTRTDSGATYLMASNLLGHAVFLNTLIGENKLTTAAILAGSEAARGASQLNVPRPQFPRTSADEIAGAIDGSFFTNRKYNSFIGYAYTKYIGALWMSAQARRHPTLRLVTVSPGGTSGTEAASSMSAVGRFAYEKIMMGVVAPLFKIAHSVDVGAERYRTVLANPDYRSGTFYASSAGKLTGPMVDQSSIFPDLANTDYQDNADEAVRRFTH
jgi:NAD(P)-dependent dehydrogenase (short-subunit alcohol dehydrogenase family)